MTTTVTDPRAYEQAYEQHARGVRAFQRSQGWPESSDADIRCGYDRRRQVSLGAWFDRDSLVAVLRAIPKAPLIDLPTCTIFVSRDVSYRLLKKFTRRAQVVRFDCDTMDWSKPESFDMVTPETFCGGGRVYVTPITQGMHDAAVGYAKELNHYEET